MIFNSNYELTIFDSPSLVKYARKNAIVFNPNMVSKQLWSGTYVDSLLNPMDFKTMPPIIISPYHVTN